MLADVDISYSFRIFGWYLKSCLCHVQLWKLKFDVLEAGYHETDWQYKYSSIQLYMRVNIHDTMTVQTSPVQSTDTDQLVQMLQLPPFAKLSSKYIRGAKIPLFVEMTNAKCTHKNNILT